MIFAFRANTLPDLKGKELPSRILVAKWGANENTQGQKVIVNETTARLLPSVNRALGRETVALDFEHNTVEGSDENKKTREPRIVAAHGMPRVVPNEGLFIENLRWTPEGEASAKGGHHPDLSPALKMNAAGEVVFLHSSALCRNGSIPDIRLFTADLDDAQLRIFSAAIGETNSTAMNESEILRSLLGLTATASATEVGTAVVAFRAQQTALAAAIQNVGTFSAQLKSATDLVAALEKKFDAQERANLVALAIRDGKVVPFGAEFDAMTNSQFNAVLEKLEAGRVPLGQRTPENIKAFSATGVVKPDTSATEDEVRKQLGISEADWKK